MQIELTDDEKNKPFSVSAYPVGLSFELIDPCGYGATEEAALDDLIDKIDEDIAILQEAKTMVRGMLNENS